MPRPSSLLRLLAFAVPAALGVAAAQPLLAAASGQVRLAWGLQLAGPSLLAAGLTLALARWGDPGDLRQPPWFSAWALLPGAFLLAGAATMCIFGSLVEFDRIRTACWALLAAGALAWQTALVLVRRASA
ncbi:MAG TPA: hypothetical protein VK131_06430 [Candidatus Acidoferrales bacterium]|nr:hypothetical protein [Candidatus Acidoferrales bacterium]